MIDASDRLRLERTVRLYPLYAFATNTYFWLPVFFLFFLAYLPFEQVLLLEAIYYAGVVLLEVPSGYFSDRFGRRITLLISAMAFFGAYSFFLVSSSFLPFAMAQILLAVGISFNSGTDTSLHFDALSALDREEEYGPREAAVSRWTFLAGAIGAILGGMMGVFALRLAYGLAMVSTLVSFVIVWRMAEPSVFHMRLIPASGILTQMREVVGRLKHPALLFVFGFYVLMTILNHVPYEFYQPYLNLLLNGGDEEIHPTPLASGIHVAAAMLIGSWFAARSIRLRDRFGLKGVFLLAAGLQVLLILSMAWALSWWVAVLLLLRTVPRALMTAPINATVAPLVPQRQRATYFSIQSLAGRLAFSLTLVLFSLAGSAAPWDPMVTSLWIATGIGGVGLVVLALAKGPGGRRG